MPFNVLLEGFVPVDQNRVETSTVKVIKSLNKLCCFWSILERDCNKVLFCVGRIVVVLPDEDNTWLFSSLGMAVQAFNLIPCFINDDFIDSAFLVVVEEVLSSRWIGRGFDRGSLLFLDLLGDSDESLKLVRAKGVKLVNKVFQLVHEFVIIV